MTSIQAEMDLRQFGEYNQFKILRQTASRESKKYFALFQSESKETVELFFGMSLFLILENCQVRLLSLPLCQSQLLVQVRLQNMFLNNKLLFYSLRRKYVVDPDLGRIDNPTTGS